MNFKLVELTLNYSFYPFISQLVLSLRGCFDRVCHAQDDVLLIAKICKLEIITYGLRPSAVLRSIFSASKRSFAISRCCKRFPSFPNVLHFTYIRNTGAAFSLFQGQDWLRWLSLIVTLALIAIGIFKSFGNIWEQLGLGFILAGAAGNGIDRLFYGSVVDFIDLRLINFAIFNWADISINLGIICLLIHTLLYQPQRSNPR